MLVTSLVLAFFLSVSVHAAPLDDEMQKLTHYAEEYETGNINYPQLLVYLSNAQQNIENILGSSYRSQENTLTAEKLAQLFGKPTESTYWLWVDKENTEKKVDTALPGWRKSIFDGAKIQITLDAWPHLFKKNNEEKIIYNINLQTTFKKQGTQDISSNIDEIAGLARSLQTNDKNALETLAKKSIQVESAFNTNFQQSTQQCEPLMSKYIGSVKNTEEHTVQEITLANSKNAQLTARLEWCDNCAWQSVNLNLWKMQRRGYPSGGVSPSEALRNTFRNYDTEKLKQELEQAIQEYISSIDKKDTSQIEQRIMELNNAWNEKANNVWDQVNREFNEKQQALTEEQRRLFNGQSEQKDREQRAHELQKVLSQEQKDFYLKLFQSYEKKEFHFIQTNYEKKIVEESNLIFTNVSQQEVQQPMCGNNKCEVGEETSCAADCRQCPRFQAIQCQGTALFKGKDSNGCELAPICIKENNVCTVDADCQQPLCGTASCQQGTCTTTAITECKQEACTIGEQQVQKCNTGAEIITDICEQGSWKSTGEKCEQASKESEKQAGTFLGGACLSRQDCGGSNDVCSNGQCISLPKVQEQEASLQPSQETSSTVLSEKTEQTSTLTGNAAKWWNNILGFVINGLASADSNETTANNQTNTENSNEGTNNNQNNSNQVNTSNQNEPASNQSRSSSQNANQTNNNPINETSKAGNTRERQEQKMENPQQQQPMQQAAFSIMGMCRKSQEKTEGNLNFQGWGGQFTDFQRLREQYSKQNNQGWCEQELENLLAERAELEKGFNQDFVKWFFETYLANDAEHWDEHSQGIRDIYWKDVELNKRIAENTAYCLGKELSEQHLINISYNTTYGSLEFWEEKQEARLSQNQNQGENQEQSQEPIPVISPYMKLWIFPPREVVIQELQNAMKEGRFPGSDAERDKGEGLPEEQRNILKQDAGFMKKLRTLLNNQESKAISLQLKDTANNQLIFNLYVQLNEQDIIKIQPLPLEKMPLQDTTVELDFDRVYSLIKTIQKEEEQNRVEKPYWDQTSKQPILDQIKNGIKIWFKIEGIINSAKVAPAGDKAKLKGLLTSAFFTSVSNSKDNQDNRQVQAESLLNTSLTGNVVFR